MLTRTGPPAPRAPAAASAISHTRVSVVARARAFVRGSRSLGPTHSSWPSHRQAPHSHRPQRRHKRARPTQRARGQPTAIRRMRRIARARGSAVWRGRACRADLANRLQRTRCTHVRRVGAEPEASASASLDPHRGQWLVLGAGRPDHGRRRDRRAALRRRHPRRFHPVRPDAAGRRAVPPPHAAGGADRACRHHALQAGLHGLQGRRRPAGPCRAHVARGRDPLQPVPAADGLCPALAPLREEPGARRDAPLPARRLEGRLRAARHRRRDLELPRQHRRGADRRHHGAAGVQGQGAHRLPRRHRRRLQRRRLGQRGRRHHHHHDVDRRREPA